MNDFPYAWKVSRLENPLTWTPEKIEIMVRACQEISQYHYTHCPEIAHIYHKNKFDPQMICEEQDLINIPTLCVTAMKRFLITSMPHEHAVLKQTSSGTRGQKTQIWFDQGSLDRVQTMLDTLLEQEGIVSQKKYNYLVFVYDPAEATDLGISYTAKNQLRFAPVHKVFYTIKKDVRGEWTFQLEQTMACLEDYLRMDLPVRILGMPAFIYTFLKHLVTHNKSYSLHPDSWMLTGGGWKTAEDQHITRVEMRALVHSCLGFSAEKIRDGFGMAEHSAPYFECRLHRFHVPVYNRVYCVDPVNLEPMPDGQIGLMHLITPFNAMMPTLSLLTTDYVRVFPDKCQCGWDSPTFEVMGRAGLQKHKGCAMTAADILRRR